MALAGPAEVLQPLVLRVWKKRRKRERRSYDKMLIEKVRSGWKRKRLALNHDVESERTTSVVSHDALASELAAFNTNGPGVIGNTL